MHKEHARVNTNRTGVSNPYIHPFLSTVNTDFLMFIYPTYCHSTRTHLGKFIPQKSKLTNMTLSSVLLTPINFFLKSYVLLIKILSSENQSEK